MKRGTRIEKRIKRKQWKEMQSTRKAKGRLERKRQVKETDIPKSREGRGSEGKGSDRKPSRIIYLPKHGELSHPKSHINGIRKTENGIKGGSLNSRMLLVV